MCGNKMRKNPLLGVVPFAQGCELFPPYQSHVEHWLPHSHKPFKSLPPHGSSHSTGYTHTCDIFQTNRRRHWHAENLLMSGTIISNDAYLHENVVLSAQIQNHLVWQLNCGFHSCNHAWTNYLNTKNLFLDFQELQENGARFLDHNDIWNS